MPSTVAIQPRFVSGGIGPLKGQRDVRADKGSRLDNHRTQQRPHRQGRGEVGSAATGCAILEISRDQPMPIASCMQ